MSRIGKYMVYNPNKGKPIKYYSGYYEALIDAQAINDKEKEDVLILEVVGKIDTKRTVVLNSKIIHDTRELILV